MWQTMIGGALAALQVIALITNGEKYLNALVRICGGVTYIVFVGPFALAGKRGGAQKRTVGRVWTGVLRAIGKWFDTQLAAVWWILRKMKAGLRWGTKHVGSKTRSRINSRRKENE